MHYRTASPQDYETIIGVVDDWWGRFVSHAVPRLFLEHFYSTSFIVEDEGVIVGFLIGFLSPSDEQAAYIHFVGVDPKQRKLGIAAELYQRFFELASQDGRTRVNATTIPENEVSIEFHRRMGFEVSEPIEGYNQPKRSHILFTKYLT
ncbi:MAG: GNAT family N-acetyltransferase [Pseudomonadota bacterium]